MRFITPHNHRRAARRLLLVAGSVAAIAAAPPTALGQEKTTLRKVEVVGLQRISSDQAIATSGLRVGDLVDPSALDVAADKLMRSGWFTRVNYRVQTTESDSTVVFEVAEKAASTISSPSEILGTVSWNGNSALTNQELTRAFALRTGETVTQSKLDEALGSVLKVYLGNGYIEAKVTQSSTRDASRRTNYQFTVHEGQQYRMGLLTIAGLTPTDARNLKGRWTLAAADIFDSSYLEQYQTTVIRPFVTSLTQRNGTRTKYEISTKPDTQKQTVDVTVTFR